MQYASLTPLFFAIDSFCFMHQEVLQVHVRER